MILLADGQTLDLMEHVLAARGHLLIAVALARQDHAERIRMELAHGMDLPRRGVRAQHHPRRGRVERAPHVARRVVGRDVQQLKVGGVILDLAGLEDVKAHLAKDGIDLAQHLVDHVDVAQGRSAAWQPDIQRRCLHSGRQRLGLDGLLALFECRGQRLPHLVRQLAGGRALLGGSWPIPRSAEVSWPVRPR